MLLLDLSGTSCYQMFVGFIDDKRSSRCCPRETQARLAYDGCSILKSPQALKTSDALAARLD